MPRNCWRLGNPLFPGVIRLRHLFGDHIRRMRAVRQLSWLRFEDYRCRRVARNLFRRLRYIAGFRRWGCLCRIFRSYRSRGHHLGNWHRCNRRSRYGCLNLRSTRRTWARYSRKTGGDSEFDSTGRAEKCDGFVRHSLVGSLCKFPPCRQSYRNLNQFPDDLPDAGHAVSRIQGVGRMCQAACRSKATRTP